MNRLPILIRVIFFALGLVAAYFVAWSRPEFISPTMALATKVAMGGMAITMLGMALWADAENPWFVKLMLIGIATFLAGAIAIMGLGEGMSPFPSFLFFASVAFGLVVLCTPKRYFSSRPEAAVNA